MRRHVGLALMFAGVCLAVRVAALSADPPLEYPTGLRAQELVVEGPAKAAEARRFGLFGTYATAEVDDYHVWSVQSPAFVGPLAGFFRVFGAGYASLRVFCGLMAALGVAGLYALGRRHPDRWVAPIACTIVCASFFDVVLTRGGLLEPYLNAVLVWTMLFGLLAARRLVWLVGCAAGFVAAVLIKQSALLVVPVLVGLGVHAVLAARRRGERVGAVLAAVCVGLVGLMVYVGSAEYWRTVEWNFGHVVAGVERHTEVGVEGLDLGAMIGRVFDPGRWRDGFFYIVPLGGLALVQVVRTVIGWRRAAAVDLLACGWLLAAGLALQLPEVVRPRFSILVLPPASLLAASVLAAMVERLGRSRLRLVPLALAAVVVLATDVRWLVRWWGTAGQDLATAGEALGRELSSEAVVVGDLATPLAFDTAADLFYVKGPFNTTPEALAGLGVTHLLLRRGDLAGKRVEQAFPAAFARKRAVVELRVFGGAATLYRLDGPLR